MSLYNKDSIVALATARGVGALSIVRVSGGLASKIFKALTDIKKIRPRYAYYCSIKSRDNYILDDVVIIFYKGPKSFTGEDSFEISCHGGEIIANNIINEIIGQGCRYAYPGEFSKRAVLNGKINIQKAEALNNAIKATSSLSANKGLVGLEGDAKKLLEEARKKTVRLLATIEHELDFVEGEINETTDSFFEKMLDGAITPLKEVADGTLAGNKLKNGFRVALIGPPNAGKSTLFNSILGYNKSIISSKKGTTRDSLEVFVEVNGVPIELIDTAGYWEVVDELDALAVEKTLATIQNSDVLIIVDDKNPMFFSSKINLFGKPCIFVKSKCDNSNKIISNKKTIHLSAHLRTNIDTLLTALSTLIKTSFLEENIFICSLRQASLIDKALDALVSLRATFQKLDLVQRVSGLRYASENLFDVYGEISNNDVFDNVFNDFCVGK